MQSQVVSVIVPVYNSERHLGRCMDSIAGQTHHHLQAMLVDDGSCDGSAALCDDQVQVDERFVCVHQRNSGVSKARNVGLDLADGDWYQFPDSDDYLESDTYEYLLGLAHEHSADIVNFEYFGTYSDHETAHLLGDEYYGLMDRFRAHWAILNGEPFACNKLYSKRIIVGNEYSYGIRFREDIARGEDSLFAHSAAERADTVWFDKRPLYHYVQSEESAVRGRFNPTQLSALLLYEAYAPLYQEKYPELLPRFLVGMSHLLIMLYYDMWADEGNHKAERLGVYRCFCSHKREVQTLATLAIHEKVKFALFSIKPTLFCVIHRIALGLR